ncbi:uncharacterized protein LOC129957363 [Argiope bruennichi]|uniref:Uncharacterized protein n=1 Tax=Argiope bruennichi TaxID=94029 RepID=A0A8T0FEK6_ARGBR|nr:uncharacterized protein LOC129957363 [Argiope bruennichi]KAF8788835.1 hypothetical protein HNY73_006839 [Argiope bruennichi]
MNPVQPPTLYTICFQKTLSILRTGLWNRYDTNPFSYLPSTIVNDLTKFALSQPFHERPKITELWYLITSGRLTELDLIHHDLESDSNMFLKMMSENVCKNLRSFSIPACLRDADGSLVEIVLRFCTNLEEVHSALQFDLDILENCHQLRNLRFHLPMNQIADNSLRKVMLSSHALKTLEAFAVCAGEDSFQSSKFVAKVLLGFPNLISVGLADSSLPLKLILKTQRNSFSLHFKLRRCFWGISHDNYLRVANTKKLSTYRKGFSKIIKMAVLSCPCTEELVINVFHEECLQHLCLLKNLTFLSINFNYCDSDYMPAWFSVLKEIGPQLKHLSVEKSSDIQLNVICDNCFNLESLRIRGKATIAEATSTIPNLPHLRRLLLMCMNEGSLMYMLSRCPLLTEMFLDCALCLDDDLLCKILKQNPLSELKVAGIHACKLSRIGFHLLLESAVKLEKVSFRSVKMDTSDLIHKLNPKIVNYPIFNKLKDIEFFRRKLHPCRF